MSGRMWVVDAKDPGQVFAAGARLQNVRVAAGHSVDLARALRSAGAQGVLVLDHARGLHWLDTAEASGWLKPVHGGAPPAAGVAWALGQAPAMDFVDADAAIVSLLCASGLQGVTDGATLPQLSWGDDARFETLRAQPKQWGIYAVVDSADRVGMAAQAGVRLVQLRIKGTGTVDLRGEIAGALASAEKHGATLVVNDHWQLAAQLGAPAVHLGQEDLQGLGADGRAQLRASGLALGISSHSIWELCRARSLAPAYVACGPVWPTTTKAMPWRPQGEHNLRWWARVAGTPVVAIGGILDARQVAQASACGASAVCVVRGLGEHPGQVLPELHAAFAQGRAAMNEVVVDWPHPSLQRG